MSTGYEQYQGLDGRDPKFLRKLIIMLLVLCFLVLIVVLGLWGSLVHSIVGLQLVRIDAR